MSEPPRGSEIERLLAEQVKGIEVISRQIREVNDKLWWIATIAKLILIPAAVICTIFLMATLFSIISGS